MLLALSFFITLIYGLVISWPYKRAKVRTADLYPPLTLIAPTHRPNELPSLVARLSQLNYSADLKIILVLNGANSTPNISLPTHIQLLNIPQQSKKDAIEKGVSMAKTEWIATVDDDVELRSDQLSSLVEMSSSSDVIASPVKYKNNDTMAGLFSLVENWALQALTYRYICLGKPIMANGALIAFRKSTYDKTQVYNKFKEYSSGDDTFLVQLASQQGFQVRSSNQFVECSSPTSWRDLFEQRARWLGKSKAYPSAMAKVATIIIALCNLVVLYCYYGLFATGLWSFTIPILVKFALDLNLSLPVAVRFGQQRHLWFTPIFALIYPFYTLAVGLVSMIKPKDSW